MQRKICHESMANRLFLLCWCTYMISCLGRFNYSAAMAELISAEGFTKSGAGLIGTALFVVYGACQIFTGILGDKISPKKMVFCGLTGSAIVNLLMSCASSQKQMLFLWMANGAFQACQWAPVARIVAEMMPLQYRKRAMANIAATIPTATILIYGMSALSIHFWGWRPIFVVPAVLMAGTAAVWLRQMTIIERDTEKRGMIPEGMAAGIKTENVNGKYILVTSGILWIAVASLAHGMLKDGIQTWVPTFMTDVFHMGTAASVAAAIVLPVFNIGGVFFSRWFIGRYIKNELNGAALFFACAIVALGTLRLFGMSNPALSLMLLTIASTSMIGANILLVNTIPIHFGAIGRASSVTGVLNCSAYAGSAISAYGIGAAAEHYGWNASVFIWLIFAVLAFATCIISSKKWGLYRQDL